MVRQSFATLEGRAHTSFAPGRLPDGARAPCPLNSRGSPEGVWPLGAIFECGRCAVSRLMQRSPAVRLAAWWIAHLRDEKAGLVE